MIRRALPTRIRSLGDRQISAIISTSNLVKQDGLILPPKCCDTSQYLRHPVVLRNHNPDAAIARSDDLMVTDTAIRDLITFAPPGTSQLADETYELVRAGILTGMSIGFDVLEAKPVDPNRPAAGRRATRWALFEVSVVSVPADVDAVITARSALLSPIAETAAWHPTDPHVYDPQSPWSLAERVARWGALLAAAATGSVRASVTLDFERRQADLWSFRAAGTGDRAPGALDFAQRQADLRRLRASAR